ncbi:MAG: phage terminase large subunit [Bacteroidales bacterium]
MTEFKLTAKQEEAQEILSGPATHGMLYGGSRSGKTFLHVRNVVLRAMKAADSRHAILRFRFNHIKASIILDTFPKVMKICFPGVEYVLSRTDWYATLPNGSQIWFGGLDDKERTEKILGQEYATMYLNECSQIPKEARDMAMTRLAQLAEVSPGKYLTPRAFYDCNPTNKIHWSYKMFILKVDPDTKKPLARPEDFVYCKMNPGDNAENLSSTYMDTLNALSPRLRKRFLLGEFADATVNSLFSDENIELWRVVDGVVPDMVRIIVSVDPSGAGDTNNADNDAIGIIVAGLGTDGICYILEDITVKAGPATWGRVATDAYDRHEADAIVGEVNYGGAMVQHVIQTARPRTNFRKVTATRGKVVRAEPISALYEQGKVRHVGYMRDLEEELSAFTTNGYTGEDSPNRADALVWAVSFLFPGVIKPRKEKKDQQVVQPRLYSPHGASSSWMSH